mgnify:CR=1 FL=1
MKKVASFSFILIILAFGIELVSTQNAQVIAHGSSSTEVKKKCFMDTHCSFYDDAKLVCQTTTRTKSKFAGFTGGFYVDLKDAGGEILGTTEWKTFGVNGRWIPGAPSKRNDQTEWEFPQDFIGKVESLSIVQAHRASNRFLDKVLRVVVKEIGNAILGKLIK